MIDDRPTFIVIGRETIVYKLSFLILNFECVIPKKCLFNIATIMMILMYQSKEEKLCANKELQMQRNRMHNNWRLQSKFYLLVL